MHVQIMQIWKMYSCRNEARRSLEFFYLCDSKILAVQKYRDAYGKRGSDIESPSYSGSNDFRNSPNSSMLESVEEGGMPILNTLGANYAKLESVRRVVHHEQGASVFQVSFLSYEIPYFFSIFFLFVPLFFPIH